ncbi:hypothetical protein Peur_000425 [Populus x canadensis]
MQYPGIEVIWLIIVLHVCIRLVGWCCECFLICGSDFNCFIGNGIQSGFGFVL